MIRQKVMTLRGWRWYVGHDRTDDDYLATVNDSVQGGTGFDTILEASKLGSVVLDFETVEALQYGDQARMTLVRHLLNQVSVVKGPMKQT